MSIADIILIIILASLNVPLTIIAVNLILLRGAISTKPSQEKVSIPKQDILEPGIMRFSEDNVIAHIEDRSRVQKVAKRDPQEGWKIHGK